MNLLTLRIIPSEIQVKIKLVPPIDIKGSVKPVTGTKCTDTAMFANACTVSDRLKPMAKKVPNAFGLLVTSFTVRKKSMTYNASTAVPPNKPYSSQMMA